MLYCASIQYKEFRGYVAYVPHNGHAHKQSHRILGVAVLSSLEISLSIRYATYSPWRTGREYSSQITEYLLILAKLFMPISALGLQVGTGQLTSSVNALLLFAP